MAWSEILVPAGSALLGAIVGTGGAILGDHVRHKKAMEAERERSLTAVRLEAFSKALGAIEEMYVTIRAAHEQHRRRASLENWAHEKRREDLLSIADGIDETNKAVAVNMTTARLVGGDRVRSAIVAHEKKLAGLPRAIHEGRGEEYVGEELNPLHDRLVCAMQADIPIFEAQNGGDKNG